MYVLQDFSDPSENVLTLIKGQQQIPPPSLTHQTSHKPPPPCFGWNVSMASKRRKTPRHWKFRLEKAETD